MFHLSIYLYESNITKLAKTVKNEEGVGREVKKE
jgi:hypothetical protein